MGRGEIKHLDAYIKAKLLDHSGWTEHLPRKITPSDGDMILDNAGRLLLVELSSKTDNLNELTNGQRILGENFTRNGKGKQAYALAKIVVSEDRAIDTTKDIISFSFLIYDKGQLKRLGPYDGRHWTKAVLSWLQVKE
ncbi:hypothetical protein [Bremerella sp. P1]|uniref:hypothetical protein n=1 Tax=Bremerella sp. P1 TaxID=3026424 RepID=UPI002367DCA7|nr:hypothetical protein [Bremerella sp. P1]WDI41841.1 hypothetical protein PSR63_25650 [Bremerella sp. P1]